MKSKISSLSKNDDFKSLLQGKKHSNKNNKKLNISFLTKKKIGNAVKRNKIKRRLRNIMNDAIKKININFNYCYLVIARSTVLNDPYENIKESLFAEFKKIK